MCTQEQPSKLGEGKLLFLADFHVKARTWTNNTQVRGDAYRAMQVIGDFAEVNGVKTLLIGGDFFDSNRPTPDDLVQTVDFLTRFEHVYYIRGNHDSCDPSYLEAISRILGEKNFIEQLDLQMVNIGEDTYLAGISWMPSKEEYNQAVKQLLEYFRQSYPGKRLYLMLHTSFQHLLSFDGAYTFDIHEVNKWCHGLNVTLLVGDVHIRNTSQSSTYNKDMAELGHTTFHSPGSVYPLQFSDTPDTHCVTLLDPAAKSLEWQIQAVPVNVRNYECWLYKDAESLDQFLKQQAADKDKHPEKLPTYIKILVNEGTEIPHIDPTEYPQLVIQVQINMTGAAQDDQEVEVHEGGYTLEQAITDEFSDPDVAEIATRLIKVPDPNDELRKYMEFWNVARTTM